MEKMYAVMNGINAIAAAVRAANVKWPGQSDPVEKAVLLVHPVTFQYIEESCQYITQRSFKEHNGYVAFTHGIPVYPSFGVPENEVHVFSPAHAGKITRARR